MCIKFDKNMSNTEDDSKKVLTFTFKTGIIQFGDFKCKGTCVVRNELNGYRKLHLRTDVVYPIVNGVYWNKPYMPRVFPKGSWNITGIEWTDNPEYAPVKIKTDAEQEVTLWELDKYNGYDHATKETVVDSGYYFHNTYSNTTLGCIRIDTSDNATKLAKLIEEELKTNAIKVLIN